MDERAVTRRVARLLAVLAVLLGLLAMHGVAGAHHAGAATPVADQQHAAGQHAATGTGAAAAPAVPSCDDDCSAVAALCVAVLAGAALALLLARRRAVRSLLAPAGRPARTPAPPVRCARGPDPVRELCVSRT